eukprot:Sdes_comp20773_c0_seq1m16805
MEISKYAFVVLGGGIAGVSCMEHLVNLCQNHPKFENQKCFQSPPILLLTSSPVLQCVANFSQISEVRQQFNVQQVSIPSYFSQNCPDLSSWVRIHHAIVADIDPLQHLIRDSQGCVYYFEKLCICTGALPRRNVEGSSCAEIRSRILCLRDATSALQIQTQLKASQRVALIGNGGIALELADCLKNCRVFWLFKDQFIGKGYFDEDVVSFFSESNFFRMDSKERIHRSELYAHGSHHVNLRDSFPIQSEKQSRIQSKFSAPPQTSIPMGFAMGPFWSNNFPLKGCCSIDKEQSVVDNSLDSESACSSITFIPGTTRTTLQKSDQGQPFPIRICYENAEDSAALHCCGAPHDQRQGISSSAVCAGNDAKPKFLDVDLVLLAIGVECQLFFCKNHPEFTWAHASQHHQASNGLLVDTQMRVGCYPSVASTQEETLCAFLNVYAAGDCCSTHLWGMPTPQHLWFQKRLWAQSRAMGRHAADCMFQHRVDVMDVPATLAGDSSPYGPFRTNVDDLDFYFYLFTHTTHFFGQPVILLGLYECQGLDRSRCSFQIRKTSSKEFIKLVIHDSRIKGAILVGDGCHLAETLENIILNQSDIRGFQKFFLDPDVDIEDYFD